MPGVKAFRTAAGVKIKPVKATLKIGDLAVESEVKPGAKEVVFNVKLKAGKTRMAGLFITESGDRYGTYYAYVLKK